MLVLLAANILGGMAFPLVKTSALWRSLFGAGDMSYWLTNLGDLLLKLAATLIMIGLLLAMGLRRHDFFLVKGQLDAPAKRIKWLPGMKETDTWMQFGHGFALVTFLLLLSGTLLINLPRLGVDNLVKALPLLPAVLTP